MEIILNGELKNVQEDITITELLQKEGFRKWSYVWINDEHILLKDYEGYKLKEGDKIKVIDGLVGG